MDLFNYARRETSVVRIGNVPLGRGYPVRIQSMTNTPTLDTVACVEQAKRIVAAGGEYVRLTTQGVREAENLSQIRDGLRAQGIDVPLVADVHFNPQVADTAARYAGKVRINPGNYVDPGRRFKRLNYTDEAYAREIQKIHDRFVPFLHICKENRTAVRIGVNHGSLSDRIRSRYGDTPEGMVESCMEFLRICVDERFSDVVLSVKASNTGLMVKTVRLLVHRMEQEGMSFPLHLGVTEAGSGEDGRIKSALGIGALLGDGLGDTIRVSLSEAPEAEIPVARKLVDYIRTREHHVPIPGRTAPGFDYLSPSRRPTRAVRNIGGEHLPVVVAVQTDKNPEVGSPFSPDYLYCGAKMPVRREAETGYLVDADAWQPGEENVFPTFIPRQLGELNRMPGEVKFLFLSFSELTGEVISALRQHSETVVLAQSNHLNRSGELRALVHRLMSERLENPVIFLQRYRENDAEDLQIKAAADMGALVFDGCCDGLFLCNEGSLSPVTVIATAFGILQAGRLRITQTEYISCPGCGRTLYDLESAIARVKAATSRLKGLKIAIMGCIVNGPGEMADADYGYVGAGRGKISLYKKKECVEKNIPETQAVEKLIELIRLHGDYVEE